MLALDTNVLLRLLLRDDEAQAQKANALLNRYADEDDALFVSDVVLAEFVWTLDRAYGLGRADIAAAVRALADNATLGFESRSVLRSAQALFNEGKAGFADCLIVARSQAAGCSGLVTFDKAMLKLPGVEVL